MLLLQLSSAQGPAECELAVTQALRRLHSEAEAQGVRLGIVEQVAGDIRDTHKSVLVSLDGEHAPELATHWAGTLLWTCKSPYRPEHKRKNWFFAGQLFSPPVESMEDEIRFEAMRASGPGGQHVNKTDSAIRATHVATGISVKVQSERSQHDNKRLARLLIQQRLAAQQEQSAQELRLQRRDAHHQVERGNPVRTFSGNAFTPKG
ncbi:peptide chain release factor H [Pseudomonas sp. Fl5BN2]|uniref:peptide chain release factor H n=1 Tax=Pseudomonas sp. Fl5BN2 TaxID=2697652 RepID=UPI0013771C14|nr:peptide chain release factor H [Pseudomonas sp. Fl5BN2]NBF06036.1 peptide chain release factor H [Pseudomonas sp. Fl5BN2]